MLHASHSMSSCPTDSHVPAFIERYGEGVFRLRLGPQTLPDYGLVLIATGRPIQGEIGGPRELRLTAGAATLILGAESAALRSRT